MRIKLFAILFIIFINSHGQISLEANINNVKNGRVYLLNTMTNQIDSIEIKNYYFEYAANLSEPTLFNLKFKGFNDWDYPIKLILSNALTSLTFFELKIAKRGGSLNNLYPNKPVLRKDPNFNQLLIEFETSFQEFYDSVNKLTSELDRKDSLFFKRKNLYEGFIGSFDRIVKTNPDKVVSAVITFEYIIKNRLVDLAKIKELFLQLDDVVKYSGTGTKIGVHINKELSIEAGRVAPYFEFVDIFGAKYNLRGLKERIVLLHFWSSTCGPCRVENRKVNRLSNDNKNLIVINVSLDTNERQWKNAIIKDGLSDMINTFDLKGPDRKMARDYYITGIPAHYLIDGAGRIIAKGTFEEVKKEIDNAP